MNRDEMIRRLEGITSGELLPDDFRPTTGYFFIEDDDRKGHFECNGKHYDPDQFAAFCDEVEQRNKRRLAYGLPTDGLFIVTSTKVCETAPRYVPEPIQPDPEPVEVFEDVPAVIETTSPEQPAIKPEVIKKPVVFNARGETLEQMQERMQREHEAWQQAKKRDQDNSDLNNSLNICL